MGNRNDSIFYDDYCDDDEAWLDDCGLMADGQCSMAGSEMCDWDCPHSHGPHYAGSAAWNEAHDRGVPIEGCACDECAAARKKAAP